MAIRRRMPNEPLKMAVQRLSDDVWKGRDLRLNAIRPGPICQLIFVKRQDPL